MSGGAIEILQLADWDYFPVTPLVNGGIDSPLGLATVMVGLSLLLVGLSPQFVKLAKLMGNHGLDRKLSSGVTIADAIAMSPIMILGVVLAAAFLSDVFAS